MSFSIYNLNYTYRFPSSESLTDKRIGTLYGGLKSTKDNQIVGNLKGNVLDSTYTFDWGTVSLKNVDSTNTAIEIYASCNANTASNSRSKTIKLKYNNIETSNYITLIQEGKTSTDPDIYIDVCGVSVVVGSHGNKVCKYDEGGYDYDLYYGWGFGTINEQNNIETIFVDDGPDMLTSELSGNTREMDKYSDYYAKYMYFKFDGRYNPKKESTVMFKRLRSNNIDIKTELPIICTGWRLQGTRKNCYVLELYAQPTNITENFYDNDIGMGIMTLGSYIVEGTRYIVTFQLNISIRKLPSPSTYQYEYMFWRYISMDETGPYTNVEFDDFPEETTYLEHISKGEYF